MSQSDPTAGDYYSRLGISPDANKAAVRKAGKDASSQYHPDNDHTVQSEELYHCIRDAKDTLESPQDRSQYDVFYFYDEENTAYTTHLYEKWFRLNMPGTAEGWLEEHYDPDEAADYSSSGDGGSEISDGEIADKKEWLDATSELDWDAKQEGGQEEDQDTNDVPVEDEGNNTSRDTSDDTADDTTKEDSDDTEEATPSSDDPRDSGLSESDLKKIRNKDGLHTIIQASREKASYDDESQVITIRASDTLDNTARIDLNTGKIRMHALDEVNKHQLEKIRAELSSSGRILKVINQWGSTDNTVRVKLVSKSNNQSNDEKTDDKKGNPNKRYQEISYDNSKPEKNISFGSDDDGGSGKDTSDSNGLLYGAIANIVAIGGIFFLFTTISMLTSLEFKMAVALTGLAAFFIIGINLSMFVLLLPISILHDIITR